MSDSAPAGGVDPAILKEHLMGLWSQRQVEQVRLEARQAFSNLQNPLSALLCLLEGSSGMTKGTLSNCILTEFVHWRQSGVPISLQGEPVEQIRDLQLRALNLLTEVQVSLVDPLLELYQLKSLDREVLVEHVKKLQACGCYREAMMLSTKLELQTVLDAEHMCMSLILQDKLALVESYVRGHRPLEEWLLKLLDSWCAPDYSVDKLQRNHPELCVTQQHAERIQPKLITRHVFRLMHMFNIDAALCPNAVTRRKLDSLKFLMYKRFVEKGLSEENWSDHVQATVNDNPELQVELVHLLLRYSGPVSAAHWSIRYAVPRDRLPFIVWKEQEIQMASTYIVQREDLCLSPDPWDPPQGDRDRYYQFPLGRDCVQMVDSVLRLEACGEAVLQPGALVGVDMEWLAGFGTTTQQHVALIQLAVQGQVFLLDLCSPGFSRHEQTVKLIRTLFSNPNITKLGYSMYGDMRSLSATWPEFTEEAVELEGLLDLLPVHKQIQRSWRCRPSEVEVSEGSAEKGLSLLVQQVLGKPLNKMEQLSNWERRPLRNSQLRYAAADAYCLLDVHQALSQDPARFGLPPDLQCTMHCQPSNSKDEKKSKNKGKQAKQWKVSEPTGRESCSQLATAPASLPISPQQLRVVCDNMLQGLGRYLRCLGVDVLMLENNDDHRVAAKLARAEGRIILTSGQPYQTLKSQVGEGCCLALDCSEKARDQAVQVLRHFHVQLTPDDVFSRCQACNGDEYMKLPRESMRRILNNRGLLQEQVIVDDSDTWDEEYEPPRPAPDSTRYARRCRWAPASILDHQTLTFPSGAELQIHTVPPPLLPRIAVFFICTNCGKVFWEGSHYERVLAQFDDVLRITEEVNEA